MRVALFLTCANELLYPATGQAFGGGFAVKNADVSTAMLTDKCRHILDTGPRSWRPATTRAWRTSAAA